MRREGMQPLPSDAVVIHKETTQSNREMNIATSRSTFGEAISKLIEGIAIMCMHVNEVNTARLPGNEKDGGREAGEVRVAPIAPHSLGGVGGKE